MNKKLLLKYIEDKASLKERAEVVDWIDKSSENEAYYLELMNLVILEEHSRENLVDIILSKPEKAKAYKELKEKISERKPKNVEHRFFLKRALSVAAVLAIVLSVCFNIYQYSTNETRLLDKSKLLISNIFTDVDVVNTFYTNKGVKGKIILPDSSVVWLNSGSKIEYPEKFSSSLREVRFEGEGFFDVKTNTDRPMLVTTPKGMRIKVLGTKFHVKSYRDDENEETTLFSGLIEVSREFNRVGEKKVSQILELKPMESIFFRDDVILEEGININMNHHADTTRKVAWKRGELHFEQTPMIEVVKMLERWHGLDIIVKDESILSYKFVASFNSESMVQIMELLKFTMPVDYRIKDDKVFLFKRKI